MALNNVLFNRVATLEIGDKKITGLRMTFKVEKSLTRDPNKIDVTVYNLSEATRAHFSAGKADVPCRLSAGYVDLAEQIFRGDIQRVSHVKNGADWLSKFEAGDGENALRSSRISYSKRNAGITEVVAAAANSMGVGIGNAITDAGKGDFRKAATEMGNVAMHGLAADELDRVLTSAGREYSVQDNQLQVMPIGHVVGDTAVVLSPSSGLIGSPEIGTKGMIKMRALIQPRLLPGWRISLDSASLKGFMRIEKVSFSGDTHGNDWYADLECTVSFA